MSFTVPNHGGSYDDDLCVWMDTDIDALQRGISGDGVVSGCAVTAQGSPDMTVAVAAGTVQIGGISIPVTGANGTISTADASNPRLDVVSINASGTIVVTVGTASAEPAAPTLPASSAILAFVHVPATDTAIGSTQIVDKRVVVQVVVHIQETTLTHAQILGLGSSAVTVVPASGANTVNFPMGVHMSSDFSAGAYSNPSIRFRYAGDTTDLVAASTNTLNSASKRIQNLRSSDIGIASTASASNKAIEISASTTVTGGNAANQYRIRVSYMTMAVL